MKFKNIITLSKVIKVISLGEVKFTCIHIHNESCRKYRCTGFNFVIETKCRQGFEVHALSESGEIIHCWEVGIHSHPFCDDFIRLDKR